MIYTCSNDNDYDNLCLFVNDALKYLLNYQYLTNSFILEYFIDDQWNFLPTKWKSIFKTFTLNDIHKLIQNKHLSDKVLPLSLMCFLKCSKIYKLHNHELDDLRYTKEQANIKPESLLDKFLSKHLKSKKIHEINKLTSIINSIIDHNSPIFDIGSGQGHLSRHLAFKFNFNNIISIDLNSKFLTKAEQIDNDLINRLKFLKSNLKPKKLNFNMNKDNYLEIISNEIEFGLIGLHACGNLSHNLLELHKNSKSKYLFLCSCCYHKTKEDRYLISEYLKNKKISLTIETRANACHSLDNFIDSFQTKPDELKVHTYRALIEYLLEKKSPKNRKQSLCKINQLNNKTFEQFIDLAIKNTELKNDLQLNSYEIKELINSKLNENLDVILFYALRTLLGPVTESILLIDRILFLYENKKIKSKLIPLFDARISPRNFLLISIK